MYFKFTNQISQDGKQEAVCSVTVFLCVFFFVSIREKSDQSLFFFSVFWMQQSITSLYFLKLLSICTGGRISHFFSLNLRASLVPAYYRGKFSFCKKKRIGLCFTDGKMWPSKISNGPPKLTWGQH